MAKKKERRRFGNVRKLPSGRFQARYLGPDGIERKADKTFDDDKEAANWLTLVQAEILRGDWAAPEPGETELDGYAVRWIAERKLAPRTRENYEDLHRLHIRPHLGNLELAELKPATIRTWRRRLLDGGTTEPQAVKAYRLLRAVLNTAIKEDGLIKENACRIKGYDKYHTPERTVATVNQVLTLADAVPPRFRALIIVAAFSGLRWGELAALRRCDVDLVEGRLRVQRKLAALRSRLEFGPPKSEAGVRSVTLPSVATEALRGHLGGDFVAEGSDALVFTGGKGALLRSGNFGRAVKWPETVKKAGLPDGFHFHDLRHTGNTLAAASGASTRELMQRLGQSSMRAALIYQHATSERDREIADNMDKRIRKNWHATGTAARTRSKRKRADGL